MIHSNKHFLRIVVTVCQALCKELPIKKIRSNYPCPSKMAQSEHHIIFQNVLFVGRLSISQRGAGGPFGCISELLAFLFRSDE